MKTPIFRLLLSLTVLALLLAACASPTASPETEQPQAPAPETEAPQPEEPAVTGDVPQTGSEPVTIHVLIRPDEGGNVALYAEKFQQETGHFVQVDFVGWAEIHDKTVTTLASGGGGYDIVFIPNANAAEFAAGDWFEPVNDLIPDSERSQWLESVVDLYTFDGDLIAVPWYSGGAHMAYNTEILEAAGVNPAEILTWDDFMAACEAIKTSGAAEFCFSPSAKYPGNFYYNWGTMVKSSGGEFFDADGNPVFQNDDIALRTLQMFETAMAEGYFDPAGIALDDYETLIEFGTGKTAFLLDSTWSVTQANSNTELSGVTGKTGIMLIPGTAEQRSGGYIYAGGLGLLRTSENKEVAKQFIMYLTSEEAQKHHAIEGANLPTRTALFTDADIAAAWPGFEVLAEQVSYGEFPPQFPWFEEWRRSAASAVQDVMGGRKTAQEAVDWLVEETNRLKNQ
ncbi:MAG: sugar ABC transporter substrate-binding protein [Chloroflexi bacterium]|jgi:multiple sugar transport system substrate-binding protein|nr:sugar ABC transporter substrate-binding protein [Chloroflexota bacterium]